MIDRDDEAERCYLLGKDYYSKGNYQEALIYFRKSNNWKKDPKTVDFMVECEHEIFQQQQNKSNHKNTSSNCHDEGTQYTQVSDETNYNSSGQINNDSSNVCFNYKSIMPKDAESRRILRSRSYYEVLGISQSATEDAIKKTYKRLALKYHPDKNNSSNADEIFNKITEAYNVLVDSEKRIDYNEKPKYEKTTAYQRKINEKETSYETFKKKFDRFNPYEESEMNYKDNEKKLYRKEKCDRLKAKFYYFFRMIIVSCLFIGSVYYFIAKPSDGLYSGYESRTFYQKMTTPHINLPYYVGKKFQESFTEPSEIEYFGVQLEKTHVNHLIEKCIEKHLEKEAMLEKSNLLGGLAKEQLITEANNLDMKDCELKDELKQVFPFLFETN